LVTPNLATEIDALSESLPQAVGAINEALQQYEWGRQFLAYTPRVGQLLSQGTDVIATITGVAGAAISIIGTAIVLLFTAFFFALDPELYVNGFLQLVPQARQTRTREVLSTSAFKLRQWLLSRFVSMVTTGVLAAVGLSLLDMPYVLTLSLIEGLSAFVPTIGPIVAAIPALLVALTQNPQLVLWIILLYWGIQLIDDYLVTPFVVQRIALLPPVLTLIPQLFMGVLFGLPGVILAAPLTVVIVVLVKMLYVEDILGNRAT
jgi:predicted PurR-regulated permease PerM